MYANNFTANKSSHAYNTHRENIKAILTSERLDKWDELVEIVKKLIINNIKYYELITSSVSDSQGNITSNPEKVTHTSNRKFEP